MLVYWKAGKLGYWLCPPTNLPIYQPTNLPNPAMPPFIEINALEHTYLLEDNRRLTALKGINLSIEKGEFVALVGPNGSGKSTLARHLNGLLLPTAGTVLINGLSPTDPRQLRKIRQVVGMVFQNPENQFVASTVEEDVAFGPENLALPSAEIQTRVKEALQIVGLDAYRTHPPQALSGGQKQLVAIAGVLANRPDCIVLDEPNAMLDPANRQRVLKTITRLNRAEKITILLITHNMSEAVHAQRILVMHAGRIVRDGTPQEIFQERENLHKWGLEVPPAVEIAHHLREQGLKLPPGLLTIEALAEALC